MDTLTKSLFALSLMLPLAGLAQCETCEPDLTCVAVDFPVLCPEQLPNATQGEPYSATATFNLPPSVVDPGSGLEATLLTVTISSVTGLPFGLEFSPNNPDGVYQPQRGILWLLSGCGTPLVSGSFFVDINVTVLVSAFGFQQTVEESFSLPLVVEPGEGGGEPSSFSLSASQGMRTSDSSRRKPHPRCRRNVCMGFWQRTNVFWTQSIVHLRRSWNIHGVLVTEVTELALTQVNITSLGGGWGQDIEDFFGAPDPYFILSGPSGGIYTSAYTDGNENPTLGGFNIPLDPEPRTTSLSTTVMESSPGTIFWDRATSRPQVVEI